MIKRISVIDVETPNLHNDKICSIGITNIVDGKIEASKSFLIDPECSFNPSTIKIHNITPEIVDGKPSFGEIWPTISSDFVDVVLVAHNAMISPLFRGACSTVPQVPHSATSALSPRG